MDIPISDLVRSQDSTPTVSQVNSDVPETCSSQPLPPGTEDAKENLEISDNLNENNTPVATNSESADILRKSDNLNPVSSPSDIWSSADVSNPADVLSLVNVLNPACASMDLISSSSSDEIQLAVEADSVDLICLSPPDVTNSSQNDGRKMSAVFGQNSEVAEQSSKTVKDINLSESNLSKVSETIPENEPHLRMDSRENPSPRILSERRRKDRSISYSPRQKISQSRSILHSRRKFSRSHSPVRFPVLSKSERRNYRRYSRSSTSSPSPRKYRSRSPPRRKRSYSSYSSSSASSSQRRRYNSSKPNRSRSTEKRHSRDSYESCKAVEEMKYGSRCKFDRTRERSSSQAPKNRRFSRRRSHSTSPKERLRRMLAHETLSKNTGCVVRFDSSRSFSSHQGCDSIDSGQRKIARVTSEVRVEVKSTVNSEKLTKNENDQMNVFQKKIRVIKKRLRNDRRKFRKRPESYPTFADEWKMFWCGRFKQIQADGKEDPHNYDYRPDWKRYWLVRVKQIYKEKYKKLKAELKDDLKISSENMNQNVTNSDVMEISDGEESVSPREEANKDGSAEPITDDQKNNNNNDVESCESKQISKEDNSTANTLSSVAMQQLNFVKQTISACMSSACPRNSPPSSESTSNLKDSQSANLSTTKSEDSIDIDLKDDISIVSVLRQLSVLETQLGASAHLITNLLANGLAREKKQAGSSVRLLTFENRLFLDVIKEKLKGQLQLEVVPDAMIRATKRCIQSIDELMRVIPEPKRFDPRISQIPEQKSDLKNSPASLAPTTHVSFDPRNNFSSGMCSMPSVYPTTAVHSIAAHTPSAEVNSAPRLPTPVQASAPQSQYPVRSEPKLTPVPKETLPGIRYSTNYVNSTNRVRSTMRSAASVPVTMPQQSISGRTVGTPKCVAHSNQTAFVLEMPVQSESTDISFTTTYSSENPSKLTKRPSIYDPVPWSEQSSCASVPAAEPLSRSFHSSSASCVLDPRLAPATFSNQRQISRVNSSTGSQLSSSISSTSHSQTVPVNSTNRNFQSVPVTLPSSDLRRTSVNLPSYGSGLHAIVSTSNGVRNTPMTSVSCNSVVSTGNSMFNSHSTTTSSTDSQIIPSSSSTTVASSSGPSIEPIIDLTDDTPDYDESDEPINTLSEARIIELLKNFRQLPRPRQQQLVDFLRELEKTNLPVVDNFKKYVQLPFNK